ncbi:MAG: ubiquinol-cytochrome c reductase iron-sulfur subunit [Xanthomonadaceae bacterium]|nr:ubiquinol-cytochrome c reductase iron-sulfur subunit [Xanthomonadaceae bacterium]
MTNPEVNTGRRRFLTASTAVVGAIGAGFAAVPFVASWQPSAKARVAGAPVQQDISKLEVGQRLIAQWRGQPVWIIRRSEAQLAQLPSLDGSLRDPNSENPDQQPAYASNAYRSIKPEIGVIVGICTHLGCSPTFVPEMTPQPFDAQWKGGFYCPCHNSRFDLAGRVYDGVPAPTNLLVPPHRFIDDNHILIGVDTEGAA